jgi:hypothetical protein
MASCQSNLHQVGIGILMYAEDNDGTLPARTARLEPWLVNHALGAIRQRTVHGLPLEILCVLPSVLVPEYVPYEPFICPGTSDRNRILPGVPDYFYHPAILECSLTLHRLDRPTDLILLHDHPFPTDRHAGAGCGVFADGHTEVGRAGSGRHYSLAWRRFLSDSPCADWGTLPVSR